MRPQQRNRLPQVIENAQELPRVLTGAKCSATRPPATIWKPDKQRKSTCAVSIAAHSLGRLFDEPAPNQHCGRGLAILRRENLGIAVAISLCRLKGDVHTLKGANKSIAFDRFPNLACMARIQCE